MRLAAFPVRSFLQRVGARAPLAAPAAPGMFGRMIANAASGRTVPVQAVAPAISRFGVSSLRRRAPMLVAAPVTAAPKVRTLRDFLMRLRGGGGLRGLGSRRIVRLPVYPAGLGGLGAFRVALDQSCPAGYTRGPAPPGQYGIWCYAPGEMPTSGGGGGMVAAPRPAAPTGPQFSAADVEAAAAALRASLSEEAAALEAARGGGGVTYGTQTYGGPSYGVDLETLRMLLPSGQTGSILD